MRDLKLVYKADTEELALSALEELDGIWGRKYKASIAFWRNNRPQLSTYFKYPSEIRTLIYTGKSWDCGHTLDHLCIYFGNRIQPEDVD